MIAASGAAHPTRDARHPREQCFIADVRGTPWPAAAAGAVPAARSRRTGQAGPAPRPARQGPGTQPAPAWGLAEVEHRVHQVGRDQHRARHVDPGLGFPRRVRRHHPGEHDAHHHADRHVDGEVPPPARVRRQHAAEQQPGRRAYGGDRRPLTQAWLRSLPSLKVASTIDSPAGDIRRRTGPARRAARPAAPEHGTARFRNYRTGYQHPAAGMLSLDYIKLAAASDDQQHLIVMLPADQATADKLTQLH